MKKLLPILSIGFLFAACNPQPQVKSEMSATPAVQAPPVSQDTSGLSEFQQWKIQNELQDAQAYKKPEPPVMVVPEKVKRTKPPVYSKPQTEKQAPSSSENTATLPSGPQADTSANTGGGTMSSESAGTAKAEEKKGMSKSTKGAVIGGVVGAGAGAVINKKNPVIGAVIGGVIGAGGGYVIGKKMDKKDAKN
jgi:hypothetical protein